MGLRCRSIALAGKLRAADIGDPITKVDDMAALTPPAPGTLFARCVAAIAKCKGDEIGGADFAFHRWRDTPAVSEDLGKRRSNHFLLSRKPSAYFLFTSRAVVRYFRSSHRPFPIVRLVRGPIQHISRRYARDGRNFSLTIYKLLKANSTLICESFLAKPL